MWSTSLICCPQKHTLLCLLARLQQDCTDITARKPISSKLSASDMSRTSSDILCDCSYILGDGNIRWVVFFGLSQAYKLISASAILNNATAFWSLKHNSMYLGRIDFQWDYSLLSAMASVIYRIWWSDKCFLQWVSMSCRLYYSDPSCSSDTNVCIIDNTCFTLEIALAA